jgi:hypothetical protein
MPPVSRNARRLSEAVALAALPVAGLAYNEVREQKAVRAAAGTSMSDSLRAAA